MTPKDLACFPFFFFLDSDNFYWLLPLLNPLKFPQSIAFTIYCGEYLSNLLANEKPHRLNVWLTLADWYTDWLTDWLVGREIPERWVGRAQGVVRHHHHLITTINIIITIAILVTKIIISPKEYATINSSYDYMLSLCWRQWSVIMSMVFMKDRWLFKRLLLLEMINLALNIQVFHLA